MAMQGRKSLRQFACNDTLWNTFERMADDQEKNVDELVNDALEAYAQLAGYQTGIDAAAETTERRGRRRRAVDAAAAARPRTGARTTARGAAATRRCRPRPASGAGAGAEGRPRAGCSRRARRRRRRRRASYASYSDGAPGVPAPPLYLVFDNQKYRIDKDQFIIGRGAKTSDLPIKDGNISRKHAAVIRRNGTYYIKDLGSTNGIDYKGMRIDNKRIDEGDVFHLCDYELRFTYKR